MTTPNRLQTHWCEIKPLLLKKWKLLTLSDLEYTDCEFDRIVNLVKERYDGSVDTVKEADIRYEILNMLKKIEEQKIS